MDNNPNELKEINGKLYRLSKTLEILSKELEKLQIDFTEHCNSLGLHNEEETYFDDAIST